MPTPKRKNPKSTAISYYDAGSDTYQDVSSTTPIPTVSAESYAPYTKRLEEAGGGITYFGLAVAGTTESASSWLIAKIDESVAGTLTVTYPSGSTAFNQEWNDRASLSYS